ncbi:MAG: 3-oxoacyl-ACP synthase [Candidatus Marinimicrobia bacterium]|nr:3-oxoacyl-ACP synthase [Candidatus Neomarinimicrobiota bacterium]
MPEAHIIGLGHYVPENIVTNDDLSELMDTSDQWIVDRTGIKERRFAALNQGPSDLAIPAVELAIDNAKINKEDIDFIIFATSTPDHYVPGSSCILQDKMNLNGIGALDIRVQCSGFVYGLSIAEQYIKSGQFNNILVIGAEVQSTAMDLTDRGRDTAVIFADGAGAAIISSQKLGGQILSTHLYSEGKYAKELWVESPSSSSRPTIDLAKINEGRHFLQMNGKEVFKHAVKRFPEVIIEGLEHNELSIADLDILIPHQANLRISKFIQKKLNLLDNQIFSNIHKYGNTTAASIPIAFSEALIQGKIYPGNIVALASFGSGFTWGSCIIKWVK